MSIINLVIVMQTIISKWGNSLAIRLPKPFLEQTGMKEGGKIQLFVHGDRIVVSKPGISLENLLKKVKSSTLHQETYTGKIVGKELW